MTPRLTTGPFIHRLLSPEPDSLPRSRNVSFPFPPSPFLLSLPPTHTVLSPVESPYFLDPHDGRMSPSGQVGGVTGGVVCGSSRRFR